VTFVVRDIEDSSSTPRFPLMHLAGLPRSTAIVRALNEGPANLRFLSHLRVARTFDSVAKSRQFKSGHRNQKVFCRGELGTPRNHPN